MWWFVNLLSDGYCIWLWSVRLVSLVYLESTSTLRWFPTMVEKGEKGNRSTQRKSPIPSPVYKWHIQSVPRWDLKPEFLIEVVTSKCFNQSTTGCPLFCQALGCPEGKCTRLFRGDNTWFIREGNDSRRVLGSVLLMFNMNHSSLPP